MVADKNVMKKVNKPLTNYQKQIVNKSLTKSVSKLLEKGNYDYSMMICEGEKTITVSVMEL